MKKLIRKKKKKVILELKSTFEEVTDNSEQMLKKNKHLENKNKKTSEKVTDLFNVDNKCSLCKFPQNKAKKKCDKKY